MADLFIKRQISTKLAFVNELVRWGFWVAGTGGVVVSALATEPSQIPLTSRAGDAPPPNVMITLDDSGSMNLSFMPAGQVTVNGFAVRLDNTSGNSDHLAAFPNDPRLSAAGMLGATIPAVKTGATAYQMQWRSSDVNSIWYNPNVRYRPWLKPQANSDGTGVYMDNSPPTAAKWDPISAGLNPANFDLTAKISALNIKWCGTVSTCGAGTKDFYPGLFYVLKAGSDPNQTANFTQYDINDSTAYSPTRTSKPSGRTDCAGTASCTQAEERQNFANWFTYYRMRETLAKGALTEALFGYQNKMRVGWGRINNTTAVKIDGSTATYKVVVKGVANLDTTQLNTLLTGIQSYKSSGGTPLRTALDSVGPYFYNRTDAASPWQTTPGATSSPGSDKLSCRRSFNLLTTDGYYNDSYAAAGDLNNTDSPYDYPYSASLPDQNPGKYSPTKYLAIRPFIDDPANKSSDSLTDVAMKWYYKDLDGTIANKVAPTDGDKAFWQHLSQFTVGIGVKGTLDASSGTAKAATLKKLNDPTSNVYWPKPDTDPKRIDDLWHAAVNTGGDFYPVRNSSELSSALTNVFSKAVGLEAREAGVATVASTLITSNVKFVPQYRSGAWYGDVLAYQLDSNGNVSNTKPMWQASTVVPAWNVRKIYSWNGSQGILFDYANLTSLDPSGLGVLGNSQDFVNYIRGDNANEGSTLTYRSRGGQLLGDFINSPPVYVGGLLDMGYSALTTSSQASTYGTFLATKKARSVGVVAAGSNDGMFHLFRASDGLETLAYLPKAAFSNLALLGNKNYGTQDNYHRFFVDGPTIEADAYIQPKGESASRWTNMIIGSMGGGGKAVFALNVPTADPSGTTVNSVQWELNSHDDLGYMLGEIRTGHIKGGSQWYAFIGNGVYSNSGKAALLVVDLQTGSVVKSVQVPTSGANGLGGVRLLRDTNQEVYAAYAGDLQGNLWRFDFGNGGDSSTWKVSFNGAPLYRAFNSAGTVQSIVAAPAIMPHPQQGYMVLFGTGRLIDVSDSGTTDRQTFYGIWDNTPVQTSAATIASPFATAIAGGSPSAYRDILQQQTIDVSNPVSGTSAGVNTSDVYYKVSTNPVNWTTKKGWYMDLNIKDGLRAIYPAQTALKFVYFSSVVPAAKAAACEYTLGSGYNFILDAVTGGAMTTPVFDTNHDGVVNTSDTVVAGYKSMADGVDKLLTGQDGVVDDFTTQVCIPDKNSKCAKANSCLVVVVNTTNTAEEVCLDSPVELCYMGYPVTDSRCFCPDGVTLITAGAACPVVCSGGSTANSNGVCMCPDGVTVWTQGVTCPGYKPATDRVWYRLVNPPH